LVGTLEKSNVKNKIEVPEKPCKTRASDVLVVKLVLVKTGKGRMVTREILSPQGPAPPRKVRWVA